METEGYNFDLESSQLLHITDDCEHPINLFEKWLNEAETNDDLGWVKIINIATAHGYDMIASVIDKMNAQRVDLNLVIDSPQHNLSTQTHNLASQCCDLRERISMKKFALGTFIKTERTEVLSRNVILRKFDMSGFTFVTERNSRKFADMKDNPNVAGTFFWKYKLNGETVLKQIRINGKVSELPPEEITKFYAEEGLFTRIRCKICKCGEPCDWDELKKKHDEVLTNFKNGAETFEQNENYTALIIQPQSMDFYYSMPGCIADRICYTKDETGNWSRQHLFA